MFLQPVYDKNSDRPNRWGLLDPQSGIVYEYPQMTVNRYQHYCETPTAVSRDIRPTMDVNADFSMLRDTDIGFLTTFHKYSYERGKYVEVLNDPINFVTTLAGDYDTAITQSEDRVGNYRVGARRMITHLGGTIDEAQLDDLTTVENSDFFPTGSQTFPLFPPVPSSIDKAPRVLLTTSDTGYIDYRVSKHPSDTTADSWRAEQLTGSRRFIFDEANNNLTSSASATGLDDRKPKIEDIETVLDAAIDTATSSDFTTFLPVDGEDITINIPGAHVIRSNKTNWSIEGYGTDGFGSVPTSLIDMDVAANDINIITDDGSVVRSITLDSTNSLLTISDGTNTVEMDSSKTVISSGATKITVNKDGNVVIDAGTNNVSLTAGKLTTSVVEATTKVITPIVSDS